MTTPIPTARPNLTARAFLLGLLVFASGGWPAKTLKAQSTGAEAERFEVASIRPDSTNDGRPSVEMTPGGGLRATHVTLKTLIEMAYEIRPEQLSGGDGWTDSEQFTVIAKGPEGASSLSAAEQKSLNQRCLQTLLRERFRLELKRDTQPAFGYVLTVDKKGPKLTVANDPAVHKLHQLGRWKVRAQGIDMPTLAAFLGVHLQTTVVDQTGLEGRYDLELDWTPDPMPSSVESLNGLPEETLIPAVREQFGLKLESKKVASAQYTIELAEKPAEN
jgi:uncharacterized protein (TIGR03435 family)